MRELDMEGARGLPCFWLVPEGVTAKTTEIIYLLFVKCLPRLLSLMKKFNTRTFYLVRLIKKKSASRQVRVLAEYGLLSLGRISGSLFIKDIVTSAPEPTGKN